ncbi:hypothetical protein REPUB_Repub10bG0102100 [Reevesia pubescens]
MQLMRQTIEERDRSLQEMDETIEWLSRRICPINRGWAIHEKRVRACKDFDFYEDDFEVETLPKRVGAYCERDRG